MRAHLSFWIGFFAAALLAVPIAGGIMRSADEQILQVAIIIFVGVATLVVFLVFVLLFRDWILRRLLGRTEVALEDVAGSLVQSVAAASAGDRDAAAAHAETFVKAGIGWYTWSNFYRWVFATALGLLLAFGAFWGTVLLFEQTRTLRVQTERIADQTALMELQTARLQEQTEAAEIQNEIMSVTLVNEIRLQILATLSEVTAASVFSDYRIGTSDAQFVYHKTAPCGLELGPERVLKRLPSQGSIDALSDLASSGKFAGQVRKSLRYLLSDRNSAVSLSALMVLDSLGEASRNEPLYFEGLFVEELNLTGRHDLHFSESIIASVACPNCTFSAYRSFLLSDLWDDDFFELSFEMSVVPSDWEDTVPFSPEDTMNLVFASTDNDIAIGASEWQAYRLYGQTFANKAFLTPGLPIGPINRLIDPCYQLNGFAQTNPFINFNDQQRAPKLLEFGGPNDR
ncbi:MAG: hypothetical protein AAFY52_05730 [Pseudomonadota bacterium]